MAEYVLKENILKYLEKKSSIEISTNTVIGKDISRAIDVLYCEIDNMPAADVQHVIHAYWIELPKALNSNENPGKCSNCGYVLSFMNYCPNCGARMVQRGDTNGRIYG